ncbi:MAG TPA: hypothetical protein VM942_09090, partial [Acidimicrobiales bacterium]|nr:hypothetical protein [Acidimicrobiales bacterium]
KTATPLVRNEPGGSFTFDVVITNTGTETVTITSLTDDVYGNLNGRGSCATGAVLAPGATYRCSFTGNFFGNAGASQTDIVTATGVDNDGSTVTARDDAIVRLVDVPPTVTVVKDADPLSRPEPGGAFTFTVTIGNTSFEPVTVTSIIDDVYGNLNGRGTCAIGAVIQPGGFYRCQFTVEFRGPGGSSQVDRVFVTVVDNDGTQASANDDARISITPVDTPVVVPPPPPPPRQLVRTGGDMGGPARLAILLVAAGLMMVVATMRSRREQGLALLSAGPSIAWFTAPPSEDGFRQLLGGVGTGLAGLMPRRHGPDTTDDSDPDDDPDGPSGGPGGGGSRPPSGRGPAGSAPTGAVPVTLGFTVHDRPAPSSEAPPRAPVTHPVAYAPPAEPVSRSNGSAFADRVPVIPAARPRPRPSITEADFLAAVGNGTPAAGFLAAVGRDPVPEAGSRSAARFAPVTEADFLAAVGPVPEPEFDPNRRRNGSAI